jgi:hypothetical protein
MISLGKKSHLPPPHVLRAVHFPTADVWQGQVFLSPWSQSLRSQPCSVNKQNDDYQSFEIIAFSSYAWLCSRKIYSWVTSLGHMNTPSLGIPWGQAQKDLPDWLGYGPGPQGCPLLPAAACQDHPPLLCQPSLTHWVPPGYGVCLNCRGRGPGGKGRRDGRHHTSR